MPKNAGAVPGFRHRRVDETAVRVAGLQRNALVRFNEEHRIAATLQHIRAGQTYESAADDHGAHWATVLTVNGALH